MDRSRSTRLATNPLRTRLLVAVIGAGALLLAFQLDRHQPLSGWLFFRYLRAVALALLFTIACAFAGHAVLVRVLGRTLPLLEHVSVAFALGVVSFFLTSFVFGIAGLYGTPFFLLAPWVLIALGARDARRGFDRAFRRLRRLSAPPTFWSSALLLLGALGFLLVWFPILTPENPSYDSRWYHLPIAQEYAAVGAIRPFSDGWVHGALPQLASLLYGWAFSMPAPLFDRIETAAHLELATFAMTLVGVGAVAERVLGRRLPRAWVALFAFPGIYCYDSGLVLGADHVAAVFAPPLFLLSLRYRAAPERAYALLLGALVAGALNTKYTAAILLPLPFAVVALSAFRRRSHGAGARAAAWFSACVVLLTAPHWLKNAVFYGDPLYPMLHRVFPGNPPFSAAARAPYASMFELARPELGAAAWLDTAKALVAFSFDVHEFPQFHGDVPVFGSLFTLFTPVLLFLGRRQRLWCLYASVYAGIACWYWLHHYDRYLQVLVPWMASGIAVVIALLVREAVAVRAATGLLVGLQAAWGLGVPFFDSHRAAREGIVKNVVDLLRRRPASAAEVEAYPSWEAASRTLPAGAKLLVHEELMRAGLHVPSLLDHPGDQLAFYWGEPGAASARDIWRALRAHGVTHLFFSKDVNQATDTVAAALSFFTFAKRHTKPMGTFGNYTITALPRDEPKAEPTGHVAYYPCDATPPFAKGLYPLEAMARAPRDERPVARPEPNVELREAITRARFLVFDERCHPPLDERTRAQFERLAVRGNATLMLRRRSSGDTERNAP